METNDKLASLLSIQWCTKLIGYIYIYTRQKLIVAIKLPITTMSYYKIRWNKLDYSLIYSEYKYRGIT